MGHIDKPATSQVRTKPLGDAQLESTQAENPQAAWADAWSRQLNSSGEIYGRLFAGMRDEFAAFAQKRLDANMETARAWSACRSINEAMEVQQGWLRCAIEHYGDQGNRMSAMCRGAVFHAEPEPVQRTSTGPKAATERKPTQEPPPQIKHAAE